MLMSEEILEQVSLDVCESMLGLSQSQFVPGGDTSEHLSASVRIRGEASYCLEIIADHKLATLIAEVMFAADASNLSDLDVRDALGEVANMIGGNLKGILGDEATLSLPLVVDAKRSNWANTKDGICVSLKYCDSGLIVVLRKVDAHQQESAGSESNSVIVGMCAVHETTSGY